MRQKLFVPAAFAVLALAVLSGCGIRRPPAYVFPGSQYYADRVEKFKISPDEAYDIALEEAQSDNKLQFLSKRPTVATRDSYVFSMPQGTGASLNGYHVNGKTGKVHFVSEKKVVTPTR